MIILRPTLHKSKPLKKPWRKVKKILPLLASFTVLGAVFYFFFFSSLFTIRDVKIEGNKNIPVDKLKSEIESQLNKKFLLYIPIKNFFLFPDKSLEEDLKKQFKRIESVSVTKSFAHSIEITLTEKRGALKWCREQGCFLINEAGIAYNIPLDEASLAEEEKYLLAIKELMGPLPNSNDKIAEENFIKSIWQINDSLKQTLDLSSQEFITPNAVSKQIFVRTNENWQIFFNSEFPIQEQVNSLKVTLAGQIKPGERKELEYIDLRVKGRVYYKIKSQAPQPAPDQPSNSSPPAANEKRD